MVLVVGHAATAGELGLVAVGELDVLRAPVLAEVA